MILVVSYWHQMRIIENVKKKETLPTAIFIGNRLRNRKQDMHLLMIIY